MVNGVKCCRQVKEDGRDGEPESTFSESLVSLIRAVSLFWAE